MSSQNIIQWYDAKASDIAPRYEEVVPEDLHRWFSDLLPESGLVIDIGAGTGRDAAWFASKGLEVVAVEPSSGMRAEAKALRPDSTIEWVDDHMPSLSKTLALGLAADIVFLGAVWMHVPPEDRRRAFRKLVSLTRSGGRIVMSLRKGPDDGRGFHPASVLEIECLARDHGLVVERVECMKDMGGRDEVSWECVVLRIIDDGTDALPLLRHVILNDAKTTTYKLGLLRSLCRAADAAAGMARETDDDNVDLPLGLVALNWLRLYVPLLAANLPLSPENDSSGERLGFVNEGVAAIVSGRIPVINLRVGAVFFQDDAKAVRSALGQVVRTIVKMPAKYTTYPNGSKIFPCETAKEGVAGAGLILDGQYLASFGWLKAPRDVWRAMQRFGAWIEPSIVAEWVRLMKGYASSQNRRLDEATIAAATTWTEPDRDVAIARGRALRLIGSASRDSPIRCVWSDRPLDADSLDIDHCFPWSAWPCGDLWNLFPAHRDVNQRKKRDRLPSDDLLFGRRKHIVAWWRDAYETDSLHPKFLSEARVSLPALAGADGLGADGVFAAMRFQRLRLQRDQQIPEWTGR